MPVNADILLTIGGDPTQLRQLIASLQQEIANITAGTGTGPSIASNITGPLKEAVGVAKETAAALKDVGVSLGNVGTAAAGLNEANNKLRQTADASSKASQQLRETQVILGRISGQSLGNLPEAIATSNELIGKLRNGTALTAAETTKLRTALSEIGLAYRELDTELRNVASQNERGFRALLGYQKDVDTQNDRTFRALLGYQKDVDSQNERGFRALLGYQKEQQSQNDKTYQSLLGYEDRVEAQLLKIEAAQRRINDLVAQGATPRATPAISGASTILTTPGSQPLSAREVAEVNAELTKTIALMGDELKQAKLVQDQIIRMGEAQRRYNELVAQGAVRMETPRLDAALAQLNVGIPLTKQQLADLNAELRTTTKAMKDTIPATEEAGNSVSKLGERLGRTLLVVGALSVAFGALRVARELAQDLAETDKALRQVEIVMGDAGGKAENLKRAYEEIIQVQRITGQSAADAGKLVVDLNKAFEDATLAAGALNAAVLFLNLGETSSEDIVRVLAGTYNTFKSTLSDTLSPTEKMNTLYAQMFRVATESAGSIRTIALALQQAGGSAAVAGASFAETVATLGLLQDSLVRARVSGTELTQLFSDFQKNARVINEVFKLDLDLSKPIDVITTMRRVVIQLRETMDRDGRFTAAQMQTLISAIPNEQARNLLLQFVQVIDQLEGKIKSAEKGKAEDIAGGVEKLSKSVSSESHRVWVEFVNGINQFFDAMRGQESTPGKLDGISAALGYLADQMGRISLRARKFGEDIRFALDFLKNPTLPGGSISGYLGLGGEKTPTYSGTPRGQEPSLPGTGVLAKPPSKEDWTEAGAVILDFEQKFQKAIEDSTRSVDKQAASLEKLKKAGPDPELLKKYSTDVAQAMSDGSISLRTYANEVEMASDKTVKLSADTAKLAADSGASFGDTAVAVTGLGKVTKDIAAEFAKAGGTIKVVAGDVDEFGNQATELVIKLDQTTASLKKLGETQGELRERQRQEGLQEVLDVAQRELDIRNKLSDADAGGVSVAVKLTAALSNQAIAYRDLARAQEAISKGAPILAKGGVPGVGPFASPEEENARAKAIADNAIKAELDVQKVRDEIRKREKTLRDADFAEAKSSLARYVDAVNTLESQRAQYYKILRLDEVTVSELTYRDKIKGAQDVLEKTKAVLKSEEDYIKDEFAAGNIKTYEEYYAKLSELASKNADAEQKANKEKTDALLKRELEYQETLKKQREAGNRVLGIGVDELARLGQGFGSVAQASEAAGKAGGNALDILRKAASGGTVDLAELRKAIDMGKEFKQMKDQGVDGFQGIQDEIKEAIEGLDQFKQAATSTGGVLKDVLDNAGKLLQVQQSSNTAMTTTSSSFHIGVGAFIPGAGSNAPRAPTADEVTAQKTIADEAAKWDAALASGAITFFQWTTRAKDALNVVNAITVSTDATKDAVQAAADAAKEAARTFELLAKSSNEVKQAQFDSEARALSARKDAAQSSDEILAIAAAEADLARRRAKDAADQVTLSRQATQETLKGADATKYAADTAALAAAEIQKGEDAATAALDAGTRAASAAAMALQEVITASSVAVRQGDLDARGRAVSRQKDAADSPEQIRAAAQAEADLAIQRSVFDAEQLRASREKTQATLKGAEATQYAADTEALASAIIVKGQEEAAAALENGATAAKAAADAMAELLASSSVAVQGTILDAQGRAVQRQKERAESPAEIQAAAQAEADLAIQRSIYDADQIRSSRAKTQATLKGAEATQFAADTEALASAEIVKGQEAAAAALENGAKAAKDAADALDELLASSSVAVQGSILDAQGRAVGRQKDEANSPAEIRAAAQAEADYAERRARYDADQIRASREKTQATLKGAEAAQYAADTEALASAAIVKGQEEATAALQEGEKAALAAAKAIQDTLRSSSEAVLQSGLDARSREVSRQQGSAVSPAEIIAAGQAAADLARDQAGFAAEQVRHQREATQATLEGAAAAQYAADTEALVAAEIAKGTEAAADAIANSLKKVADEARQAWEGLDSLLPDPHDLADIMKSLSMASTTADVLKFTGQAKTAIEDRYKTEIDNIEKVSQRAKSAWDALENIAPKVGRDLSLIMADLLTAASPEDVIKFTQEAKTAIEDRYAKEIDAIEKVSQRAKSAWDSLEQLFPEAAGTLTQIMDSLLHASSPEDVIKYTTQAKDAIEKKYQVEIDAIEKAAQEQEKADQEAYQAAKQIADAWHEVTTSVTAQIKSILGGPATILPPSAVLANAQSEFQRALTSFRAGATPEGAQRVSTAVQDLLTAAPNVITKQSTEYGKIFRDTLAALAEVQKVSGSSEGQPVDPATNTAANTARTTAAVDALKTQMAVDMDSLKKTAGDQLTALGFGTDMIDVTKRVEELNKAMADDLKDLAADSGDILTALGFGKDMVDVSGRIEILNAAMAADLDSLKTTAGDVLTALGFGKDLLGTTNDTKALTERSTKAIEALVQAAAPQLQALGYTPDDARKLLGLPQAQFGAWDTGAMGGLWQVHPHEMILDPVRADAVRGVLSANSTTNNSPSMSIVIGAGAVVVTGTENPSITGERIIDHVVDSMKNGRLGYATKERLKS